MRSLSLCPKRDFTEGSLNLRLYQTELKFINSAYIQCEMLSQISISQHMIEDPPAISMNLHDIRIVTSIRLFRA